MIHCKPDVDNTVAYTLLRPTKLHGIRDEGKQVTISPGEATSILSSTYNNFKKKSVWIATLNAAEVTSTITSLKISNAKMKKVAQL